MDLTQVEQDVLRCLSESRVTASAVTLAADLWHTTDDWAAWDVEPLITWTVESLCAHGLVTYIERTALHESIDGTRSVRPLPASIRLTPAGWALMGYPNKSAQVGTRDVHALPGRPTGDRTNYRNHQPTAVGGPIEKEDFATHKDRFPHHIHMYGDIDMNTRSYNRVTPEVEASVIFARNELGNGGSYSDIATMTGLPERTVKYVLVDLPRLRRLSDGDEHSTLSLKERIAMTLQELDEVRDAKELVRILGRGDSEHDVVHVLHSLHTQGKVDFRESAKGKAPTSIHLVKRGRNGMNGHAQPEREKVEVTERLTAYKEPRPIESPGEAEAAAFEASLPPEPTYPLLDALLDRERERQSGDHKGMAYVTAAEAIEAIDPEAARDLMAKAEALSIPFPSPIEQEYILYVANHPTTAGDFTQTKFYEHATRTKGG
jgi:hypothetical protein